MSPLTNLGITRVDKRDFGAASGVVNAAHQIGGAIGLSAMVALTHDTPDMAQAFKVSMTVALFLSMSVLSAAVFGRDKI